MLCSSAFCQAHGTCSINGMCYQCLGKVKKRGCGFLGCAQRKRTRFPKSIQDLKEINTAEEKGSKENSNGQKGTLNLTVQEGECLAYHVWTFYPLVLGVSRRFFKWRWHEDSILLRPTYRQHLGRLKCERLRQSNPLEEASAILRDERTCNIGKTKKGKCKRVEEQI